MSAHSCDAPGQNLFLFQKLDNTFLFQSANGGAPGTPKAGMGHIGVAGSGGSANIFPYSCGGRRSEKCIIVIEIIHLL